MDLMEYFYAWIVFGNAKLRVKINHSIRKNICKSTERKKGMFCLLFAIIVRKKNTSMVKAEPTGTKHTIHFSSKLDSSLFKA